MAQRNSLRQAIRLDLCQPENKREEALPWKLSRSPVAEARKEQDWNHYACGMAYISQVHRNLAD